MEMPELRVLQHDAVGATPGIDEPRNAVPPAAAQIRLKKSCRGPKNEPPQPKWLAALIEKAGPMFRVKVPFVDILEQRLRRLVEERSRQVFRWPIRRDHLVDMGAREP